MSGQGKPDQRPTAGPGEIEVAFTRFASPVFIDGREESFLCVRSTPMGREVKDEYVGWSAIVRGNVLVLVTKKGEEVGVPLANVAQFTRYKPPVAAKSLGGPQSNVPSA